MVNLPFISVYDFRFVIHQSLLACQKQWILWFALGSDKKICVANPKRHPFSAQGEDYSRRP